MISGLLALIAFVAVFPMLTGGQGAQALALTGISITADEAGGITIPFAAVLLDANADPAGAVVLPIDNAGGGADTFALVAGGGLAVGGYMYVGATEKFSTIDTGALDAVNNTAAAQVIDDLSFSTGVGNAFSAVSIASIITQLPADTLSAPTKITFNPPGATWVKARLASDPVAVRTLFWARISWNTVQAAQTDLQRLTYSPHRIGASSGAAGNANGASVSAGTSGGVAAQPINVYQTTGAKFFNGLTGVTSTGATLESAAGLFVGLSTALLFGDGTAGNATVTVAGDVNSVTLAGGVDKVGAASLLTVAPALVQQGIVGGTIAASTYTATATDVNAKPVLAGTNVIFTLDGAATFAGGLQQFIGATTDTGLATVNVTIASLTPTSGGLTATSGTATAGAGTYRINGGAQSATLAALSLDAVPGPAADVVLPAGTTNVVLARAGLNANLRINTLDAAGNPVASVAAGTLTDAAAVDVAINAALDANIQITQAAVPLAGQFGDLFAVNAPATATLGVHTISVLYPLNTAANPAFNSAEITIQVVAALTVATATLSLGDALAPSAGPGVITTITATLTGADGDVDGTADPAPDGSFITWVNTGGTLLTVDVDANTAGIQTAVFAGTTSIQVLSTGVAGVSTVTATSAVAGVPTATKLLTFTAATPAVTPAAASVVIAATSTSLTVGDSTTVTATVTNDDDSVGAGATGRWSEGVAVSTVTSNVKTTDATGATSTTYTADAAGDTVVTFTVVSLTGGIVVDTAVSGSVTISATAPVVPEPEAPAALTITEQLSATSGYAAWIGSEASTASAIFADITSASIIWHWNGTAWESYATIAGGTELPGSVNFDVALGAIMFFG